ncbi:Transcription factor [Apiospora arundinis]
MDTILPSGTSAEEALAPKRKLRKGTHSCTECKRRKIRCFFHPSSPAACIECQRKDLPCISQDLLDVSLPGTQELKDRLKRVEQMLEGITENLSTSNLSGTDQQQVVMDSHLAPAARVSESQRLVDGDHHDLGSGRPGQSAITPDISHCSQSLSENLASADLCFAEPGYEDTCRALHVAFPSQHDTKILFNAAKPEVFLQAHVIPYQEIFGDKSMQTIAMLSVHPTVTVHPVILARKLLHLALCVQQLDPSFDTSALHDGGNLVQNMHRYYQLASTVVTCHDDLLDSMEGLECLVCEAMYLVNKGDLRRALVCLRRCCTLSQLMGLHRGGSRQAMPKKLDPTTAIDCRFIWSHIAYFERYVSLLLGMPTAITSARFGSEARLPHQIDAEWFERTQADICDSVIARFQQRDYDPHTTRRIDGMLDKLANAMPTSWWNPIHLRPGMGLDEMLERMLSAMMQIIHYNMLTVLHLPYLFQAAGTNEPGHTENVDPEHSRDTCLYASREVLRRYVGFRSWVRVVYCCRPVDFCAFTAIMTLLLSGMLSQQQQPKGQEVGRSKHHDHHHHHQRVGDRALVEQTLQMLEELNALNGDELTREIIRLTRALVELANYAATNDDASGAGLHYTCRLATPDEEDALSCGGAGDGGAAPQLYLSIPYFGVVKLESEASFSNANAPGIAPTPFSQSMRDQPGQEVSGALSLSSVFHMAGITEKDPSDFCLDVPMPDMMAGSEEWAFQGVDTTFFDSLIGGGSSPDLSWP